MRTVLFSSMILLIVLASCKKDSKPVISFPDGDYTGLYYRSKPTPPGVYWVKSNVTMHFRAGQYSGNSDSSNYPILCQGKYSAEGVHLNVVNTCYFTANIDWTYVFDGQYDITYDGTDLILVKKYANGEEDHYILKHQQ